eukprot:3405464-Alexandrium_andersonii.AAC.1
MRCDGLICLAAVSARRTSVLGPVGWCGVRNRTAARPSPATQAQQRNPQTRGSHLLRSRLTWVQEG